MDGKKNDTGKLPLYRVIFQQFPKAIHAVAECSKLGHDKYELGGDWDNFKRVEDPTRFLDAMLRHLDKSGGGLAKSDDGDITHLAQVAWNILAFLEIKLGEDEDSKI